MVRNSQNSVTVPVTRLRRGAPRSISEKYNRHVSFGINISVISSQIDISVISSQLFFFFIMFRIVIIANSVQSRSDSDLFLASTFIPAIPSSVRSDSNTVELNGSNSFGTRKINSRQG